MYKISTFHYKLVIFNNNCYKRPTKFLPHLDVEVSDISVVEEGQALQQVGDEAHHVRLVGHLVVVQHSLQVAAAASARGKRQGQQSVILSSLKYSYLVTPSYLGVKITV